MSQGYLTSRDCLRLMPNDLYGYAFQPASRNLIQILLARWQGLAVNELLAADSFNIVRDVKIKRCRAPFSVDCPDLQVDTYLLNPYDKDCIHY